MQYSHVWWCHTKPWVVLFSKMSRLPHTCRNINATRGGILLQNFELSWKLFYAFQGKLWAIFWCLLCIQYCIQYCFMRHTCIIFLLIFSLGECICFHRPMLQLPLPMWLNVRKYIKETLLQQPPHDVINHPPWVSISSSAWCMSWHYYSYSTWPHPSKFWELRWRSQWEEYSYPANKWRELIALWNLEHKQYWTWRSWRDDLLCLLWLNIHFCQWLC